MKKLASIIPGSVCFIGATVLACLGREGVAVLLGILGYFLLADMWDEKTP